MSHMTTKPNGITPAKFEADLAELLDALVANFPAATTITVNGRAMKQKAWVALVRRYLKAFRAVDPVLQAYRDVVNRRRAVEVEARELVKALRAAVKTLLGNQSPLLSRFGIPMDTARTTSAQDTLVSVAKRRQTRAVRGTKGRKQRLAIKTVGNPPLGVTSEGELNVGAPPVNVAPPSTPAAAPEPGPAPASGTGDSGTGHTPAGA